MNELLVILAISVIIIGFLILVGIALWLAMERRRNLTTAQSQPAPQRGSQPAAPPQPASQEAHAAAAAPAVPPAATAGQASSEPAPGNPAQKEPHASGEYPSASLYDQTLLPPPKRRTRPPSE
ncbi:MAG TPA: hypothetical protein VH590_03515 [Ktedonobacterales bacterium]|jgi:predicted lipid-binding transport protein (Tim44 family)